MPNRTAFGHAQPAGGDTSVVMAMDSAIPCSGRRVRVSFGGLDVSVMSASTAAVRVSGHRRTEPARPPVQRHLRIRPAAHRLDDVRRRRACHRRTISRTAGIARTRRSWLFNRLTVLENVIAGTTHRRAPAGWRCASPLAQRDESRLRRTRGSHGVAGDRRRATDGRQPALRGASVSPCQGAGRPTATADAGRTGGRALRAGDVRSGRDHPWIRGRTGHAGRAQHGLRDDLCDSLVVLDFARSSRAARRPWFATIPRATAYLGEPVDTAHRGRDHA